MRVLIFTYLAAACWASGWLLGKAIHMWLRLRRRRRDDLMALADSLAYCGHIGRASEPGHLWHECQLPRAHDAGPAPLHYCRCGTYWRRAPHETAQIADLNAMFDAPDYQHVPEEGS